MNRCNLPHLNMSQDYQSGVQTKMFEMDQVLSRIEKAVQGEMYQYTMDSLEVDTPVYLDEEYGSLDGLSIRDLGGYIVDLQTKAEVRQ